MASEYRRLLDPRGLTASMEQRYDEVFDAGAYNSLQIQCRVLKAGSAGAVKLQHAAINEADAYADLSGASFNLNTTTQTPASVNAFLRYIRWVTDVNVAGNPVALIDVIAKE